jgi:hypothetical protein
MVVVVHGDGQARHGHSFRTSQPMRCRSRTMTTSITGQLRCLPILQPQCGENKREPELESCDGWLPTAPHSL